MTTAREEALRLLEQTIEMLTSAEIDLIRCLRMCQHACELLQRPEEVDAFRSELNGYSAEQELPWYRRKVHTVLKWERRTPTDKDITRDLLRGEPEILRPRTTTQDIRGGISRLIESKEQGLVYRTGREKTVDVEGKGVAVFEIAKIPSSTVQRVIRGAENRCFDFVSQAYRYLKFGNEVASVFEDYRNKVDAKLADLGLTNAISVAYREVSAKERESWRNAVLGCRNMLQDLADFLWKDKQETYLYLPGQGKGDKLPVTSDKPINRLAAYLHQKGARTSADEFLRKQLERLWDSIDELYDLESKAHRPVTYDDARLSLIMTYLVLGELVFRTDMEPVIESKKIEEL